MKLFSKLYDKILVWSEHRHAVYYLSVIAFSEALIFPVPPDVMLVSMGLVKPDRAWFYAAVTLVSSILGGMLGYLIGILCFDLIYPYLLQWGYESAYLTVHHWFETWGSWGIVLASYTPIPFKIISISAGAARMPFYSFVLAAIIGRGSRFLLVSALMFLYGEKVSLVLRKYIDKIGLALIGIVVLVYVAYVLLH